MTAFVPLPPSPPRSTGLRQLAERIVDRLLPKRASTASVDEIAPHLLAPAVWHDRDHLTYAEIGAILNTTPAQVAKLILEARRELEAVRREAKAVRP